MRSAYIDIIGISNSKLCHRLATYYNSTVGNVFALKGLHILSNLKGEPKIKGTASFCPAVAIGGHCE